MESQITCPNCCEQYREDNLPRLLVACGHTFCEQCLQAFFSEDGKVQCPEDNIFTHANNRNILELPKNQALIKLMASKNNPPFKVSSCDVSKITKKQEALNNEDEDADLISFINGQHNTSKNSIKSIQKSENQPDKVLQCEIHHKPKDIVCTIDMIKICASCAIFGQHKGHQFKSLDEIEQIRISDYTQLLSLFEQKQKLQNQLQSQENKKSLLSMVSHRKKHVKKQIQTIFKQIMQKIEKQKHQAVLKLNMQTLKVQTKIKSMLKFDQQLLEEYEKWEKLSFQQIQILQSNDQDIFEEKMNVLLSADGSNKSITDGQNIMEKMNQKIDRILYDIQNLIEKINVTIKPDAMNKFNSLNFIEEAHKENSKHIKNQLPTEDNLLLEIPSKSIGSQQQIQKEDQNLIESKRPSFKKIRIKTQASHLIKQHNQEDDYLLDQQVEKSSINAQVFSQISEQCKNNENKGSINMICKTDRNDELISSSCLRKSIGSVGRQSINSSKIASPYNNKHTQKQEKIITNNKKKKLSQLKIPQKYQKVLESFISDSSQLLDLTNAELGDSIIMHICEYLPKSKVRILKLIRNKLTDDGIAKLIPNLTHIITLNLSQNVLTDNVLDILADSKEQLPNLRNIILSQNRVNQRKNKLKLEQLKKWEWTVSL